MHPKLLAAMRMTVALVWLYEGLWLKVVRQVPQELKVVESVLGSGGLSPRGVLTLIGAGETLLGLGVLSGLFYRFLAWFQGALLIAMNALGILFGGGAISDPPGLLIHNLPFLLCIALLGIYGPGAFTGKGAKSA